MGSVPDPRDDLRDQYRIDDGLSLGHDLDRPRNIHARTTLQQVPLCTRTNRGTQKRPVFMGRQETHAGLGECVPDGLAQINSARYAHLHIQQYHIRPVLLDCSDGLVVSPCRTDNDDVPIFLENRLQPMEYNHRVIDEQHTNLFWHFRICNT